MRDRKHDVPYTHATGKLKRHARQAQRRLAAWLTRDFDIAPTNPMPPSRAERFHRRFFRRKPPRIAFVTILESLAVHGLFGGEQPLDERVAVAKYRRFDAVDFGDVQTQPDDQSAPRSAIARSRIIPEGSMSFVSVDPVPGSLSSTASSNNVMIFRR